MNEEKEKLKLEIQQIFTKIRNEINNREDKLLLEIEKYFENKFFDENLIKKAEKLPEKIKYSLEKGKSIEKELEKAKLNSMINDFINIENEIKDINLINDGIKKSKENEIINIKFKTEDESIQNILKMIKELGNIYDNSKFIFIEGKNYTIDKNGLVATKTGDDGWNCTILFNKEIPKNKISRWKIKLNNFYIKSNTWNILNYKYIFLSQGLTIKSTKMLNK